MIIYIDIDETICHYPEEHVYHKAVPIEKYIKIANELYDKGHTIVYWTARGSLSGKDYTELTKTQFEMWGVKYHELILKKPYYDLFIDDRTINSFEEIHKWEIK